MDKPSSRFSEASAALLLLTHGELEYDDAKEQGDIIASALVVAEQDRAPSACARDEDKAAPVPARLAKVRAAILSAITTTPGGVTLEELRALKVDDVIDYDATDMLRALGYLLDNDEIEARETEGEPVRFFLEIPF